MYKLVSYSLHGGLSIKGFEEYETKYESHAMDTARRSSAVYCGSILVTKDGKFRAEFKNGRQVFQEANVNV